MPCDVTAQKESCGARHRPRSGWRAGAETVALARKNPGALITALDISPASLREARTRIATGLRNISFVAVDVRDMPFAADTFDHVFVCFLLEHLPGPPAALAGLRRVLRPGGTITVIEGDHGSAFFHLESAAARAAIACQVELQRRAGGNAMLGRTLFPLLQPAGFESVRVSPRMVYVDAARPELVNGFTRRTFTAMIAGVRNRAIASGMTTAEEFDAGLAALERTTEPNGTFCYSFFKASGRKR